VLPGTLGLDQNVFVVTKATQKKYNLTTIASIKSHASGWTFGAPAECSTYYFCAPGLKKVYGIVFKQVKSYDESGPLTVKALQSGAAEVVELFSTDPVITSDGFYQLTDNLNLEPADHLVPVIRKSFDTAAVRTALAKVNNDLTTAVLTNLDGQPSEGSHPSVASVASQWLKSKNLIK
jgi:osmoprotectant transport system substrate-binding protein